MGTQEAEEHLSTVPIGINSTRHPITPGQHTVQEVKQLGHVPLADELEQIIGGQLTPLPDDGTVTIQGGELFASHPRSGGSS